MMTSDAHRLLADAVSRQTAGDAEAALTLHRRALSLAPSLAPAWRLSSHAAHMRGRTARAARLAERALALDPLDAMAHALRGLAAILLSEAETSAFWLRRAIVLAPAYAEALGNLAAGLAAGLAETDGPAPTALWAARAVALNPASAEARLTLANARLALGRWREAWADHELRLPLQGAYPHALSTPRWTGAPAPGATLLVHDEIGYGDVFNHARYLPLARARVGRLVLEVKPGLTRLFQGFEGVDQVLERGAAAPSVRHDMHLPIESLPGLFGTTPQTVPPEHPAPCPSPDLVERWRVALPRSPRLRVGLVWAGSAGSGLDRARSCRLADLASLGRLSGIDWISLQRGPATGQIPDFPAPLADTGSAVEDFAETAAVILQLDAVVTVDTSVAHLSAALGCPTLILLARWPAWRWLLDRTDTPWYRTAELYRQREAGGWRDPVAAVAARLAILRDAKTVS
jgi:hypothetical protein